MTVRGPRVAAAWLIVLVVLSGFFILSTGHTASGDTGIECVNVPDPAATEWPCDGVYTSEVTCEDGSTVTRSIPFVRQAGGWQLLPSGTTYDPARCPAEPAEPTVVPEPVPTVEPEPQETVAPAPVAPVSPVPPAPVVVDELAATGPADDLLLILYTLAAAGMIACGVVLTRLRRN